MARAYLVYIVMFAALIGGMLLIMTMGDSVRAPDDLSGEWVVEWDNAPPPESAEPKMLIDQSGRFFVVRFGRRPPMSMTLQPGWTGKGEGRKLSMRLARPQWELHLSGDIPAKHDGQVPEMTLELVGSTRHVGIARRVRAATVAVDAKRPADRPIAAPATPAPAPPAPATAAAAETAHAR
ncbi:MAG: hypothetical protein QOE14_2959 [Humisphaera sp.]|nr:hypothetical protein [Humisphaera sp.]